MRAGIWAQRSLRPARRVTGEGELDQFTAGVGLAEIDGLGRHQDLHAVGREDHENACSVTTNSQSRVTIQNFLSCSMQGCAYTDLPLQAFLMPV